MRPSFTTSCTVTSSPQSGFSPSCDAVGAVSDAAVARVAVVVEDDVAVEFVELGLLVGVFVPCAS